MKAYGLWLVTDMLLQGCRVHEYDTLSTENIHVLYDQRGNSEKEGSWIREVCVGETEWSEKAETYQRERTEHEEWSS